MSPETNNVMRTIEAKIFGTTRRTIEDNANFMSGDFDINIIKEQGELLKVGTSEATQRVIDEAMRRIEIADQTRQ